MAKLRVHTFSMSVDGFVAGPDQGLDNQLGGGFRRDGNDGIGATIMGRNMFGPVRDEWPDESWTGWN